MKSFAKKSSAAAEGEGGQARVRTPRDAEATHTDIYFHRHGDRTSRADAQPRSGSARRALLVKSTSVKVRLTGSSVVFLPPGRVFQTLSMPVCTPRLMLVKSSSEIRARSVESAMSVSFIVTDSWSVTE